MGEALFSPEAGLFVAGVLASSVLGFLLCSGHMTASMESRVNSVCWYWLILIIFCSGASWAKYKENRSTLFAFVFMFSIALIPMGAMLFEGAGRLRGPAFWTVLTLWTFAALGFVLDGTKIAGWSKLALALGTIWTSSGVIISLGLNPLFPYAAEPIKAFKEVHALLDVRHISAIGFGILLTGISLARTFAKDLPRPRDLPKYRVPTSAKNASHAAVIMVPFIALFNFVLLIIHALLNVIWKILYVTVMFFLRLGREFGAVLREMFGERAVLWLLAKLLSLFILCVVLTLLAQSAAAPILSYLLESSWSGQAGSFFALVALAAGVTVAIIGLVSLSSAIDTPPLLRSEAEDALQASAFGMATILSNILVSAGVLFAVTRIWFHDIQGFQQPGILATILFILVAGGISVTLLTRGLQREG